MRWLRDNDAELLISLVSGDGRLLGLLVLSAKRSELPYTPEDRRLLKAVAASTALALENLVIRETPTADDGVAEMIGRSAAFEVADLPAAECRSCRRLFRPETSHCPRCEAALSTAPVPFVLAGKFQLEKELGSGGMGVVYRALDLDLGRRVAIKTLPRVSRERERRLRREARAMASVMHPNLALIFGAESWRETPMLILEYLPGGNLRDRLQERRLELAEVVDLGLAMAGAVERAHDRGVLHRDIKPSNIAFTTEGEPKLLDFGLATLLSDPAAERLQQAGGDGTAFTRELPADASPTRTLVTRAGRVVGTPCYLCPEAAEGAAPAESFDLWSLSVVLLEAIAGFNPFQGRTVEQTFDLIHSVDVGAVLAERGCPTALAEHIGRSLSSDAVERPKTATDVRLDLSRVREAMG